MRLRNKKQKNCPPPFASRHLAIAPRLANVAFILFYLPHAPAFYSLGPLAVPSRLPRESESGRDAQRGEPSVTRGCLHLHTSTSPKRTLFSISCQSTPEDSWSRKRPGRPHPRGTWIGTSRSRRSVGGEGGSEWRLGCGSSRVSSYLLGTEDKC